MMLWEYGTITTPNNKYINTPKVCRYRYSREARKIVREESEEMEERNRRGFKLLGLVACPCPLHCHQKMKKREERQSFWLQPFVEAWRVSWHPSLL